MQSIVNFFHWFTAAWNQLFPWLVSVITAVGAAVLSMLKDLFCWAFDGALSLASTILNSMTFDFSSMHIATYINQLPPAVINVLSLIQLGPFLAILVAAVLIKISITTVITVLHMIP